MAKRQGPIDARLVQVGMSTHLLAASLAATCLTFAFAQTGDPQPRMTCNDGDHSSRGGHFCEIREQTIAYPGKLSIDGRQNGGVSVRGWSRGDVLVRMKVQAQSDTDADAKALAGQVKVTTGAGQVASAGPTTNGNESWSVSYEVFTPRSANLDITTHNGGVSIGDVHGQITFSAVNGGVHLDSVGGSVRGETVNGGLDVALAGARWDGDGLDVRTTNGGVTIALPESYSAQLSASTVNGGFHTDYPLTVSGRIDREISTTIGSGGAPLKVATTNGGVHIRKI